MKENLGFFMDMKLARMEHILLIRFKRVPDGGSGVVGAMQSFSFNLYSVTITIRICESCRYVKDMEGLVIGIQYKEITTKYMQKSLYILY